MMEDILPDSKQLYPRPPTADGKASDFCSAEDDPPAAGQAKCTQSPERIQSKRREVFLQKKTQKSSSLMRCFSVNEAPAEISIRARLR
jgi:hypothetical protein